MVDKTAMSHCRSDRHGCVTVPNGSLRIRLPTPSSRGYFLKALNGHGAYVAQSVEFYVG